MDLSKDLLFSKGVEVEVLGTERGQKYGGVPDTERVADVWMSAKKNKKGGKLEFWNPNQQLGKVLELWIRGTLWRRRLPN